METKWAGADRGRYDVTYDTETSAPHRGLKASVQQWADSGSVLWQSGTTTFSYNARRELEGSDFSVGTSKGFTFAYNLMGKRASKVQNGSATTYAAAAPNVDVNEYATITGAHAESGLAYDDNGNMAQDSAWHYEYDADEAREREDGESAGFDLAAARSKEAGALRATTKQNRLTKMTRKSPSSDPTVADRLEFQYDYLSRRTRKTAFDATSGGGELSDTVFVWSGWNLVSELNANDSLAQTRSYLWGQGYAPGGAGALLAVKVGTAVYYPVYDPTANVTGYLNASGTTVSAYEYSAYGELTNQGNYTSATFAHGFSTQYTDRESGLVYYGYRYYDPRHGRFINRDPIEESGGLNLYSFVGNSPANGWDVLGLNPGVPAYYCFIWRIEKTDNRNNVVEIEYVERCFPIVIGLPGGTGNSGSQAGGSPSSSPKKDEEERKKLCDQLRASQSSAVKREKAIGAESDLRRRFIADAQDTISSGPGYLSATGKWLAGEWDDISSLLFAGTGLGAASSTLDLFWGPFDANAGGDTWEQAEFTAKMGIWGYNVAHSYYKMTTPRHTQYNRLGFGSHAFSKAGTKALGKAFLVTALVEAGAGAAVAYQPVFLDRKHLGAEISRHQEAIDNLRDERAGVADMVHWYQAQLDANNCGSFD